MHIIVYVHVYALNLVCPQELQEAFTDEAVRSGDEKLLLTIAAAGGSYFINAAYEPSEVGRCL